ncbi:sugar transferase [Streptococcus suis]|uniref:sugar transferase n=1 Tax=Streptococcus suis TaxID=1307 RepID=UPI0024125B26|nr:sugar transferase [Streptococcus suis]MDG4505528.1 sugar transferase [Streptococcus suis]QCO71401.1 glucosyl-1-phosphate transferase [Streptococcus suis]
MSNELGYRQAKLAFYDMIAVLIAALLTSQIPEADLNRSGILIIVMVHYFAFFISRMPVDFEYRGYLKEFEKTINYSLIFAIFLTAVSFMLESNFEFSRRGVVYFTLINFGIVYLLNCVIKQFKDNFLFSTTYQRKTVLITTAERWKNMQSLFESDKLFQKNLVALVVLGSKVENLDLSIPLYDSVEEAVEFSTREVVDHVFINLPSEYFDLKHLVSEFELLGIDVSVDINSFGFKALKNKKIQLLGDHSIVTFSTNFYKPSHIMMKRLLDILGAIVGLLICGLASIVLVPIIRRDGGPAIFVQKRVGKNGRIFKFYKFRSMYIDAEERKQELMDQNQMQGGMFKLDNDPRITPIGHFIRKTSLDELPQFYNVLIGDMSLVGTRPPTVDEFEKYSPSQKRRLSFKPGITGLWQVSGRSNITDFDEVVKLDVEYIDNWNIWSDIKILLRTFQVVIKREGSK